MDRKNLLTLLGLLVGLWLLVVIVRFIFLGEARTVIKLPASKPLSGLISQGLGVGPDGSLPVDGQDYSLSAHYFEATDWAVVLVAPLHNNFDPNVVVLHKKDGAYQVALGPGTAFAADQIKALPPDVGNYLMRQVVVQ